MHQDSVTATIDWLAFTLHWNQHALINFRNGYDLAALASIVTGHYTSWIPQKPRNGYSLVVSAADRPGLCVMASEPNSPMGVHISWGGSALREVEPRSILRQALAADATIRRIDIAIDIPSAAPDEDLYNALALGSAITQARSHQLVTSNTGWTIYVGSRTSEKFLRIYDKQAEAGLDHPLTRVELECKNDYAEGIAKHIDQEGYHQFPGIITAFCDFRNVTWWTQNLTSPTLSPGIPKKEKTSDTKRWLMESVAPALAKVLVNDHDFYVSFLLKVMTIAGLESGAGEVDIFDGMADFDPPRR